MVLGSVHPTRILLTFMQAKLTPTQILLLVFFCRRKGWEMEGKGRKGILFIVHLNRKGFLGKPSLYLSCHANHPVSYLGIQGNLDKFKV